MYLCGKKRGESECTEVGVFHSVHTLNARSIVLSVNLDMVRKSDGLRLRDCQYLFVLFLHINNNNNNNYVFTFSHLV